MKRVKKTKYKGGPVLVFHRTIKRCINLILKNRDYQHILGKRIPKSYYKPVISKKKNVYNSEFSRKRKLLLGSHRKNGGCTKCGVKNYLTVHHIDEDVYNNDDNNLSVLCWKCHSQFHKHMKEVPPKWLPK